MYTLMDKAQATFFEVRKERRDDKYFVVGDWGEVPLSEVSERYSLVSNRDLVKPLIDKFGADSLKQVSRQRNRFTYKIDTGRTMEFTKGDILNEQIVIQNSYDKSRSFSFMFGAFRMVCSNGLYTGQAVINFKKIHVGEIPVGDIVKRVLGSYGENDFSVWRDFQKVSLSYKAQRNIVEGFNAFESQEEEKVEDENILYRYGQPKNAQYYNALIRRETNRVLDSCISGKTDPMRQPENGWGLLNALNSAITRSIRRNDIGKVILANQRAEGFLKEVLLKCQN